MSTAAREYTKPVVKNQEMPEAMAQDILEVGVKAFQEYRTERDIASVIKRHADNEYTPTWNCIVGKSFGSFVTHETKRYVQFTIGHMSILVWKCG